MIAGRNRDVADETTAEDTCRGPRQLSVMGILSLRSGVPIPTAVTVFQISNSFRRRSQYKYNVILLFYIPQ